MVSTSEKPNNSRPITKKRRFRIPQRTRIQTLALLSMVISMVALLIIPVKCSPLFEFKSSGDPGCYVGDREIFEPMFLQAYFICICLLSMAINSVFIRVTAQKTVSMSTSICMNLTSITTFILAIVLTLILPGLPKKEAFRLMNASLIFFGFQILYSGYLLFCPCDSRTTIREDSASDKRCRPPVRPVIITV